MARKVFVEVIAKFDLEGQVTPLSFVWEDGREFMIERVTDVRRAASLKAGGQGMRYTCIVMGKQTQLFLEYNNQWFIEGKDA